MVVDGRVLTGSPSLEALNVLDIHRIEIVKGEAARALYGERGRNGVIQVTTK